MILRSKNVQQDSGVLSILRLPWLPLPVELPHQPRRINPLQACNLSDVVLCQHSKTEINGQEVREAQKAQLVSYIALCFPYHVRDPLLSVSSLLKTFEGFRLLHRRQVFSLCILYNGQLVGFRVSQLPDNGLDGLSP